jgi:hypothetical protein
MSPFPAIIMRNNEWGIVVLKFQINFCGTIPKVLHHRGLKLNYSKMDV